MARHPKESNLFFVMAAILLVFQVVLMATVNRPLNAAQSTHRLGDTRSNLDAYKYDRYISFGEMENRLQNLKAAYPNKLNVKVVGQSVEGRNIYLVTITDNMKRAEPAKVNQPPYSNNIYRTHRRMPFNVLPRDDDDSNETPRNATYREIKPTIVVNQPKIAGLEKPVIFVDAGIHAREWVAPAAAFYLIDQLLITPSLTSDLEWRIIPMVNPDGYVYSQASGSTRFWRKNRAKTRDPNCVGVDLNRNFDVFWEETHQDPCSEAYGGTSAFSEPESQAIRDQVLLIKNRLQAYITIHTYGQLFLYPYGYTQKKTPVEVTKLKDMGDGMAKAVYDKYQNEYTVGQASMIGAAAGGSDDWAYMHATAPYSYTFELQSKVSANLRFKADGFDLHASKLKQAVDECWLALNYLGTKILKDLNQATRVDEKIPCCKPTTVGTTPEIDSDEDTRLTPSPQGIVPHTRLTPSPQGIVPHTRLTPSPQGIVPHTRLTPSPQGIVPHTRLTPSPQGIVPHPQTTIDVRRSGQAWTDLLRKVNEAKKKAEVMRNSPDSKACIRVDDMYVCPHIVFWNSMLPSTA